MNMQAIQATPENFAPYGCFQQVLNDTPRGGTGGWKAWMTKEVCMDNSSNVGLVMTKAGPATVGEMAVLRTSQKVLVCGNKPLVFAVSTGATATVPKADDLQGFILQPGQLITLNPGVWHSVCYSADGASCYYYFLSHEEKTKFVPMDGQTVTIVA